MTEFGDFGEGTPQRLEAPGHDEIEEIIRDMVGKYEGEELIVKLSEFCRLAMVEVLLTQDQNPVPLAMLGERRLRMVSKLVKPDIESNGSS